jgi:hypothetical protein
MGDWLLGSLITTTLVGFGWFFFTQVLPRRVADRTARPPEQPLTQLPGVADQPGIQIDAEAALSSSKQTHDVFLSEADDLILQARVAGLFADNLLAEAAEKAGDAVKLRPGSFAANLMVGEINMKRAMLADAADAIAMLEQAAVSFATASEAKKGVIDAYVGRAWAHLERAHRLESDQAAAAYLDASEVFLKGFRVSPQNLFILRGWGIAIDGLARTLGDRAEPVIAAEEGYRLALAEHRGGDHELHEWYAGVRDATEPVRIPMPPVRDRF